MQDSITHSETQVNQSHKSDIINNCGLNSGHSQEHILIMIIYDISLRVTQYNRLILERIQRYNTVNMAWMKLSKMQLCYIWTDATKGIIVWLMSDKNVSIRNSLRSQNWPGGQTEMNSREISMNNRGSEQKIKDFQELLQNRGWDPQG